MTPIGNPQSPTGNQAVIDRENPWPGLASFTEEQRAFFHGRDDEIIDLTELAERRPLVVLFGQSGLGKSSILQAGVFPRLRTDGFCPVYIRLDHGEGAPVPAEQIKELVRTATAKAGTWTKPGAAKPGETLWEFFHHRDDRLVDRDGLGVIPVLVFDQFEELFTLGAARGERRDRAVAFMRELAELVENRPPARLVARLDQSAEEMEAFDFGRTDYRVIISLREDFLPDLESLKSIMPALMQKRMRLSRMTGRQALDAVLKPGRDLVTPEVASAIVEFVAGGRGGSVERLAELDVEPALLSVICRELNERRRAAGQAQITADLVTGNRREILTDFYERSVTDLPAAMRTFVEDHLLTKSGFRDNLSLEAALEFPGVTRPLIATLVDRRLLRLEDRLGVERVELAHDVLAEVIRASRDAQHQRLAVRLADQRSRRQRRVIAGLAAAIVILGAGSFLGLRRQQLAALEAQRLAARRGSHTDLILASRFLGEGKNTDGLAYLVRAARRDPENPVVAPRILSVLLNGNFLLPKEAPLALPSPALKQQWSADGRTLFVQGEDGVIRALDIAGWRLLRTFTFERKVVPDGWSLAEKNPRVLAVGFEDGSLQVCDAMTGAPRMPPFRPKEGARGSRLRPVLSPDGKWVVAGEDEKVWLWDAETGEQRLAMPTVAGTAVFTPDSRRIVTKAYPSEMKRGGPVRCQLWSVPTGTQVGGPLGADLGPPYPVMFSPDGRVLVARSMGSVLFIDCESGLLVREPLNLGSTWESRGFTPDGRKFIFSGERDVRVFDLAKGEMVFPQLPHEGPVMDIEVRQNGQVLFTNSADGMARLWDLRTGALLAEPTPQQTHYTPATLSPDGTRVVLFSAQGPAYGLSVGGGATVPLTLPTLSEEIQFEFLRDSPHVLLRQLRNRAIAVDVASGREVTGGFVYPQPLNAAALASGTTLFRFTPDQQTMIARLVGNRWQVWKRNPQGLAPGSIALEGLAVPPIGVHATNNLVVFSGPQFAEGRAAAVWDLGTGKRVGEELRHKFGIYGGLNFGAQLSANGRQLGFVTQDDVVRICDFPSAKELFAVRASVRSKTWTWRFSPDGSRIVTADKGGGVHFSDATNGRLIRSALRHRGQAEATEFSPDGKRVLSRSEDGTAQVWEVATGTEVGARLVHNDAVVSSAFSPDGKRVATGTSRGELRIWDTATGLPLTEPMRRGSGAALTAIQFSPDGRFLSTLPARWNAERQVSAVPPAGSDAPPPEWLLRLATITAGKRLSEDGELANASEELNEVAKLRAEVATLPASAPFVEWGRWFLSDSPTRPIAPGFKITPDEAKALAEPNRFVAMRSQISELLTQGKFTEAEPLLRQLLEREVSVNGEITAAVAAAQVDLAEVLVATGRCEAAEPFARAGLATRETIHESGDLFIEIARSVFGCTLAGQRRFVEAEPVLVEAATKLQLLGGQVSTGAGRRRRTWNTAAALIQLYEATGRPEKAEEWKKILATIPDYASPASGR